MACASTLYTSLAVGAHGARPTSGSQVSHTASIVAGAPFRTPQCATLQVREGAAMSASSRVPFGGVRGLRTSKSALRIHAMAGEPGPGLLPSFDPPAFLTDLTPENLAGWSNIVSRMFRLSKIGNPDQKNNSPRPQFFDPTRTPVGQDFATKEISWTAFPKRNLQVADRFFVADDREEQDEYCEWSVERDTDGKIVRVSFTCEAPDYWEYLASVQPETVLQLYRQHVSAAVQREELFPEPRGKYNRKNKWNADAATGVMHLIQEANTLSAEIELAAGASIVRPDVANNNKPLTDSQALIECGQYGDSRRFSDPLIGAEVNALARQGALVTIANPVGLYFDSFVPIDFETPDGTDAAEFWKWTRGENGFYVRAVFEVPPEKGYAVGDILIGGNNIQYGSMLADFIRIKLVGLATNFDPANVKKAKGCVFGFSPSPLNAPARNGVPAFSTNGRSRRDGADSAVAAEDPTANEQEIWAKMQRMVVGIDEKATAMDSAEIDALLKDPFAQLVLLPSAPRDRPQSLNVLTKVIMEKSTEKVEGLSFFVGDGSQISFADHPQLDRSFRFVWARVRESNKGLKGDILVVSGPDTSSKTSFLQVAAWDPTDKVFNFYTRDHSNSGQWQWNGNSMHAFDPRSRGKGPFDGHIHGSLVMKELKLPWNNWHSSLQSINDDFSIDPRDPLLRNPFFMAREQADRLEKEVVAPGIRAWTRSRLEKTFEPDGTIRGHPADLLQHVLKTATVNLISSANRSKPSNLSNPSDPDSRDILLPLTFFCNADAFSPLGIRIKSAGRPEDKGQFKFRVPFAAVYKPTIDKFEFRREGLNFNGGMVTIPGDTFFAFLVPEPAREDVEVVKGLLADKVLSARFMTCALMVDFHNPVYSSVRPDLMEYVPETGTKEDLEQKIVDRILAGAARGEAAALEFKRWYDVVPDQLAAEASQEINNYLTQAVDLSNKLKGFEDYVRLSNYRRSLFAGKNKELNEFNLTLPKTNIQEVPLKMLPNGTVGPMSDSEALKVARIPAKAKCQAMASLTGCPFAS